MKRLAVLVAALAVLAGCTTIPTSSSPEVVRTVPRTDDSQAVAPDTGPGPGLSPFDIMKGFVGAELVADGGHSQARQYLTSTASRKWQDGATVILDEESIHDPVISGDTAAVTISGRRVGFIDATGVFSPILKGMGAGDDESFSYTLTRRAGQWRIDSLPPGTLIGQSDFNTNFHARKLYFFDSSNAILVPDLRYTSLENQSLASWLLTQLQDGPRKELSSLTSSLPDQVGKATVTVGKPISIDIPGSGQLGEEDVNSLAAQLAFTLGQLPFTNGELRLTDGNRPVTVPTVSGPTFSAAAFSSDDPDNQAFSGTSYFIRDGVLYKGDGTVYSPEPNQQLRNLSSIAIRRISTQGIQVASVTQSGRFQVGDPQRLATVALKGTPTSRPEWSPQGDDVWIAVGSTIYRVASGQTARPVIVTTLVGGPPAGDITAIRFSPDGVRVALVIGSAKGPGALWIGTLVNSGSDVQIDSLEPITPPATSVTDAAWADQSKLYVITAAPGAGQAGVTALLSDGSQSVAETKTGLPGSPTSITAARDQNPIVSANGLIVELDGSAWSNINGSKTSVPGTNPIYVP